MFLIRVSIIAPPQMQEPKVKRSSKLLSSFMTNSDTRYTPSVNYLKDDMSDLFITQTFLPPTLAMLDEKDPLDESLNLFAQSIAESIIRQVFSAISSSVIFKAKDAVIISEKYKILPRELSFGGGRKCLC